MRALAQDGIVLGDLDHVTHKRAQLLFGLGDVPVEPTDLIVLAVGVVITVLRAAHLITAEQHRNALREKEGRDEVSLHSFARAKDAYRLGWTFGAPVAAVVVVRPVLIVFAVRLVEFVLVGNEIVQSEAVVAGDKVDTGVRLSPGG